MPPKKKGSGPRTNKKKKGSKTSSSSSSSASRAPSANNDGSASTFEGAHPDMSEFERRNQIRPDDYPTIYQRYKEATKRFLVYMKKQAEALGVVSTESDMSVNTLVLIADEMHDDGCTMDPLALNDLKMSIRIRSRVAKSVFGGGDSGHQHLLTVLIYCWTVLVNLPKEATHDNDEQIQCSSISNSQRENRFEVFQDNIDDEELDENNEECFPTSVPRPAPEAELMSLEQLLQSDEHHDASLFLFSLNDMMRSVVGEYHYITINHHRYEALGNQQLLIMESLVRATVVTNMCIQQVHRLDAELTLLYPHLSTPYRLLGAVILPDIISDVVSILRKHARETFTERDATIFVGDCLECAFRNIADIYSRYKIIVPEFCKAFDVGPQGSEELREILVTVCELFVAELPIAPMEYQTKEIFSLMKSKYQNYESHCWLSNMPYISGGRAIHHTIRLLQLFGHTIMQTPDNHQSIARRGVHGPTPWVQGRSSKIAGDLDELLMADILPPFITIFRHGILGKVELPMMNEIGPLWINLRDYVRHPGKAVSWTLAFSVHALLTAVLETDQIADTLMSLSERAFHKYFKQVDWATDRLQNEADSTIVDSKFFQTIANVCRNLKFLGPNLSKGLQPEKRAIWNPLYAGTILSYMTYFGTMEAGCALVDRYGQLRIVLFLFQGLLLNGIVESGSIPFLDILYTIFKNCRAVWGGPMPRRGELMQRFLITCGMNQVDAEQLSQEVRENFDSGHEEQTQSLARSRKMTHIKPEEISKSYRRVCNNDFHDLVDKYNTPEQRQKHMNSDHFMLLVRINDTMDAICEEQHLLFLNLISSAAILEQFVCSLIRIMKWDHLFRSAVCNNITFQSDHRHGALFLIAHELIGALDFSSDPMEHMFLGVPVGRKFSTFLSTYFQELNPEDVLWFDAIATNIVVKENESGCA